MTNCPLHVIAPLDLTKQVIDVYQEGLISTKCFNAIKNDLGPNTTLATIMKMSDAELLRIPNIGRRAILELRLACGASPTPLMVPEIDGVRQEWISEVYHRKTDLGFEEWKKAKGRLE